MKNQSQFQKPKWQQFLFNGPVGLVVAAGLSIGVGLTPQFVSAQNAETVAFTSPLDGGQHQNDGELGGGARQTFLADALGITVEELAAAREAARGSAEGGDEFQAQLAAELGITPAVLVAAQDAARAALDQAIEDGEILGETAAEREALREAQRALNEAIDRSELVANVLGISVEELAAAREAGTSIREIANDLGIDDEALRAAVETAYADAVQQAVVDGVVTQEEADAILAQDDAGNNGRGNRGDNVDRNPNRENGPARPTASDDSVGDDVGDGDSNATEDVSTDVDAAAIDAPGNAAADGPRQPGTREGRPNRGG